MDRNIKKKVSCHIITYNHIDYICKCIDGVLMQKTNFPIEIIIGDDNSTDGTLEVVISYANKYPDLIKLNLRNSQGTGIPGKQNFMTTLEMCSGEFICLCDGDDYWTDPLKLQKQVDFLEANDDYNICFHKVEIFNQAENELTIDSITRDIPETTNIDELAKGNFIHTPSVVMRNNFVLPNWFSKAPIGDWTLYMIAINDKKIKKLDDVMAVYRVHGDSIWASKTQDFRILNTIKSIELVIKSNEVSGRVKNILKETIKDFKNQLLQKPNLFFQFIEKARGYLNV